MKKRAAIFRSHDQRLYGGLPVRRLLLRLRELQDVIGRVLERPAARYGILKFIRPAQCSQPPFLSSKGLCLRFCINVLPGELG